MTPPQQRTAQWDTAEQTVVATLRACLPQYRFDVLIVDAGRGPILDVYTQDTLTDVDLRTVDCAVSALGWRGWGYAPTGIAFKPTTVRLDPEPSP